MIGNFFRASDGISAQEATLTPKVTDSLSKDCAHWRGSRWQVLGPWVLIRWFLTGAVMCADK